MIEMIPNKPYGNVTGLSFQFSSRGWFPKERPCRERMTIGRLTAAHRHYAMRLPVFPKREICNILHSCYLKAEAVHFRGNEVAIPPIPKGMGFLATNE
jgi:hypothetical protein